MIRKMKKLKIFILIITLVVLSLIIAICSTIFLNDNNELPKTLENIDYVVVLGARVYDDESLSNKLKSRLDIVIKNFDSTNSKIIVSGGQGDDEPISEAEAMQKYLIANGIDKNRIIIENKATSTYENLLYSKQKIENFNKKEVLIISNSYHLPRVKMLSKRLGYTDVYYMGTNENVTIKDEVREISAYIKSYVFDRKNLK